MPEPSPARSQLQLEAGTLDWQQGLLYTPNGRSQLGQKDRQLLAVLVPRAGAVVSNEVLCQELWPGQQGRERALAVAVHRLRTRIELDPERPVHLRTVRGEGYVLDLLPAPAPAAAAPAVLPSALVRLTDGALDLGTGVVRRSGRVVELGTGELELVRALAASTEPVPREALKIEALGYRAQSRTRAVDAAIARLRRKLEPDPAHPVHLLTVRGRGLQLVPAPPPTGRPLAFSRPLFGREADLLALQRKMAAGLRSLVLVGPAGVGKSRLATELFDRWFGARGLWVQLDAHDWATPLAAALGVQGAGTPEDIERRIGEALVHRGRMGLLLDEADALAGGGGPLARWLELHSELVVIATSRERLGVPGEVIHEVGPLEPAEALALYEARVGDLGVELPVSAVLGTVRTMLAEHDHLPLAIELLAGMADTAPPWAASPEGHAAGRALAAVSARGSVLEAALLRSWERLTPGQQSVLAQSSVFCAAFTAAAAECVLDSGEAPLSETLALLRRKSLLRTWYDASGELRFELLHTVRTFAQAHGDPALLEAASARHVRWAVGDARAELALALGRGPMLPDRFRSAELREVLRRSSDPVVRADAIIGLRQWYRHHDCEALARALAELGPWMSRFDPERRACLAILELYLRGHPAFSRDLRSPSGTLTAFAPLRELSDYLALADELADERLASGLRFLVAVAAELVQPELTRALAGQLAAGSVPRARAWGESLLAMAAMQDGDPARTLAHAERATALARAHGSPEEGVMALTVLAICYRDHDRLEDALAELALAERMVPSGPLAEQTATVQGLVHLASLEPERALDAFSRALDASRLRGEPQAPLDALAGSALAELDLGRRRACEAWLALAEQQPLPPSYALEFAAVRALCAWDSGDVRGARERLTAAFCAPPQPSVTPLLGLLLGLVLLSDRQVEAALRLLDEAWQGLICRAGTGACAIEQQLRAALALARAQQGDLRGADALLAQGRRPEGRCWSWLLTEAANALAGRGGGLVQAVFEQGLCERSIAARLLRAIGKSASISSAGLAEHG